MWEIFFQSFQKNPDAIALTLSGKRSISYQELYEAALLWAKSLVFEGVGPGDLVAVLTKTEELYLLLHLAIDYLNATIVLFSTSTPSSQRSSHIQILDLKKIVLDMEFCSTENIAQDLQMPLFANGILPLNYKELSAITLPIIKRNPDIPNYIGSSSGTTGLPKLIPIGTAGMVEWLKIEKEALNLGDKDSVLFVFDPAFDASISIYVRSLGTGARLVMMPQGQRRDFNAILQHCEQEKISCLMLIASLLAGAQLEEMIQRLAKAGLRHLMVTGDACTLILKHLCEKYQINLWNCYGPTEATFGISILCVNYLDVRDENGHEVVPVGFPNSERNTVHIEKGRLYIKSPFLTTGYLKNPELTDKNFPVLPEIGRVFDTGDKFSTNNPFLIFKGRIDEGAHCKVSGVKVDPHTIHQCIEHYNELIGKEILQVCVVIKHWLGNNKPFAYVVVQNNFDKNHFRNYLKNWLRKEETPILIALPEFPRLPGSGKIARKFLIERKDHPDEFFFNEGAQNVEKFSAGGAGLVDSDIQRMSELVVQINNESDLAYTISGNILSRYQENPLCGAKPHHILEARNILAGSPLSALWRKLFGLSHTQEDQDFTFIGGDSLLLKKLLEDIQRTINPDYGYAHFPPLLTLGEIRKTLSVKLPAANNTPVLIKPLLQTRRERLNYFFLPPLLGEGFFTYKVFVKEFELNHPGFNFYGLTHNSIYDTKLLAHSLKEAAYHLVEAIKSVQPNGPYYLLGFSFGTIWAYLVALELRKRGDKIEEIHLVDGFPPALYQKLPPEAHAALLEELINFIIKTLNNSFYNEQLKPIKLEDFGLDNFEKLSPITQINKSFEQLSSMVIKPESKAVLVHTRQNLLYMLKEKKIEKLDYCAKLYLSTPHQTYLNVIYKIPDIIKKTADCRYYYWNKYFQQITLSGKRPKIEHLALLQNNGFGESAYSFWERIKPNDVLLNNNFDHYGPRQFYFWEPLNVNYSVCHLCSLDNAVLDFYKKIFLSRPQVLHLKTFLLYERIAKKTENEDTVYLAKYGLSFAIPKEERAGIDDFLNGKIKQYEPRVGKKLYQIYTEGLNKPHKYCINLDIYWNDSFLMSLCFTCYGEHLALLKQIYEELKVKRDNFSDLEKSYHNLNISFDFPDLSFFNALDKISTWLNGFILLLLPHIESPVEEENKLTLEH